MAKGSLSLPVQIEKDLNLAIFQAGTVVGLQVQVEVGAKAELFHWQLVPKCRLNKQSPMVRVGTPGKQDLNLKCMPNFKN